MSYCSPIPNEPSLAPETQQLGNSSLVWRQRKLIVRSLLKPPIDLPSLRKQEWLIDCLKRSPITLVAVDLELGETYLKVWADACKEAEKSVYLRLPSVPHMPQKQCQLGWLLKRAFDWLAAIVILLLLSPIMLGLSCLLVASSPGSIFFRQWRVGERGKLFQIIKFRSMVNGAEHLHHQVMGKQDGLHKLKHDPRITLLGQFMRKYSLDELPQLFNVLRGEMSLVGPRPWALYDAVRISSDLHHRLNALPGITGAWQVQSRSLMLDLDAVNRGDINYLNTWSLWQDLKVLLLTIPKVISGFGAY